MRRRRRQAAGQPKVPPLPTPGAVVEVGIDRLEFPVTSRIEAKDGWALTIVAPTQGAGRPIRVVTDEEITISWADQEGWWRACTTLSGTGTDVVELWHLAAQRVERWQRREAFRLEVTVPVRLRLEGRSVDTTTQDLSETGLRCQVPFRDAPGVGTALHVDLTLPDDLAVPANLPASVVRSERLEQGVELGLAFAVEDPRVRELLRRFVFETQLHRRAGEG